MRAECIRWAVAIGTVFCMAGETRPAPPAKAAADSSMTLKGGDGGTVFKSLTIEGEDRVRIEFERPPLSLDLDPLSAPGLDWNNTAELVRRCDVDLVAPYLALSAGERSPYLARPWLDGFSSGDVVRFRPALKDVERWRLTIADSRSRMVAEFKGTGECPEELGWNGRSTAGAPMPPGLVYSYVVEAYDRAGNKRNFVGKGFELPSYRIEDPKELVLLFAGKGLGAAPAGRRGDDGAPPALILDAASRLNQSASPNAAVRVAVTARTYKEADTLAKRVGDSLAPLLLGDPGRVQYAADVQPDAPEGGTVAISAAR